MKLPSLRTLLRAWRMRRRPVALNLGASDKPAESSVTQSRRVAKLRARICRPSGPGGQRPPVMQSETWRRIYGRTQ